MGDFIIKEVLKHIGQFADEVVKIVRENTTAAFGILGAAVADRDQVIELATGVFQEATEKPKKPLVEAVLRDVPPLVSPGLLASTVQRFTPTLGMIEPVQFLNLVSNIGRVFLGRIMGFVGTLPLFRDAIFSNAMNTATLDLVWSRAPELVEFLIQILECAKLHAPNTSQDGEPPTQDRHGAYNELDFRSNMNRHALLCQFQRLVLSVTYIWQRLTDKIHVAEVESFLMNEHTKLESDVPGSHLVEVSAKIKRRYRLLPATKYQFEDERWIFINGIAGEYHWTRLGCEKLSDAFGRNVTGVVNRGDGILWDLIECAGERTTSGPRTADSQRDFTRRTQSSFHAQERLTHQLREALDDSTTKHIVVVAHSQGCLILRLALDEIVAATDGIDRLDLMRDRVCIFTFGNPSVNWQLDGASSNERSLVFHVLRTEHFANASDFVAQLGVLGQGFDQQTYGARFQNSKCEWFGHLFGAQYSLALDDYGNFPDAGERSWLLSNCPLAGISWLHQLYNPVTPASL